MPSTKDLKPSVSESSFFLIGDGGAGKTTMIGTFPKPHIIDTDKGVAALSGVDVDYRTFKDAPYKGRAMPERGIYEYGTAWPKMVDHINEIGDLIDKGDWPFETLAIDSATTLSSICMNYVLKSSGLSGKPPQIQNWGAQSALMETLFDQLTAWPLIKIITAHVQRTENDLMGTKEMLPLLTGKFAAKSSIYFDEVYFVEMVTTGTGDRQVRKSILHTQSDSTRKQARSRFNVPDGIEAKFSLVKAAIEKAAK